VKTFLKLNVLISLPVVAAAKKSVSTNRIADYPDLKKFIAEFENAFPHMRLVNVALETNPATRDQHLTFGADVVTMLEPQAK
jgi:hypothetical protein